MLLCGDCGEVVQECHYCSKKFEPGDTIICFRNGDFHFCSRDCLCNWVDENYFEDEVQESTEVIVWVGTTCE